MTKTILFDGYSDDIVHITEDGDVEEHNVLSIWGEYGGYGHYGTFHIVDAQGKERVAVHVIYGDGGIWTFAPQHLDAFDDLEGIEVPWGVRPRIDKDYSVQLAVHVPEEWHVRDPEVSDDGH